MKNPPLSFLIESFSYVHQLFNQKSSLSNWKDRILFPFSKSMLSRLAVVGSKFGDRESMGEKGRKETRCAKGSSSSVLGTFKTAGEV